MAEFIMPNLGADMEAATLVKWHVQPGDAVKRGDVIAEVETEKGIIEIECFETGVLQQVMVAPGAKIPVGKPMALIQSAGGAAPEVIAAAAVPAVHRHASPLAKMRAAELGVDWTQLIGTGPGGLIDREDVETAAAAPRSQVPSLSPTVTPQGRLQASPLARRLAAEHGIDLSKIRGTGPNGVIERIDVERAMAASKSPAVAAAPKGMDGMRRAIAAAMAKSNREIPHYYLQTRIDMSRTLHWLESENQRRPLPQRLLPAVVLLKAVAKALRDVPALNGFWIDNEPRPAEAIHIGFAIAQKGGGLIAPAIHHVDRLSCDELMAALRDLIPRARSGRLRSSELTDATITLTSLGDLGVETVLGVIYPPQVALVGFGKILEQPWAQNGMLGVHPIMNTSLAADHRATDGHLGAQFLEALNHHFQAPETL